MTVQNMRAINVAITAGGCTTSRREMCQWVTSISGLQIPKVEVLSNGAAYGVMFNQLFPNSIPISKVNMNAKANFEKMGNFKILQMGFKKVGVSRAIPIDDLLKGKFQDNLEFIQWFKKFYDANFCGEDYPLANPVAAVAVASSRLRTDKHLQPNTNISNSMMKKPTTNLNSKKANVNNVVSDVARKNDSYAIKELEDEIQRMNNEMKDKENELDRLGNKVTALEEEKEEFENDFTGLKISVEVAVKEREYYFKRLMSIERLIHDIGLENLDQYSHLDTIYKLIIDPRPDDDASVHDSSDLLSVDESVTF